MLTNELSPGVDTIEQAREMIARGDLGEVRIVQMQFAHGFHNEAVELANPAARWRMDPKQERAPLSNRGAALWGNLVISPANWPARIVATVPAHHMALPAMLASFSR